MGPTNEVLRQFVGKAVLLGFESLDYWNQHYNRRAVENEMKKLDADGKRKLAEQLLAEVEKASAPAARTEAMAVLINGLLAQPSPGSSSTASRPAARPRCAIRGDDRVRLIDRHGGQTAEVTARGARGLAALGLEREPKNGGVTRVRRGLAARQRDRADRRRRRHDARRESPGRPDHRRRAAGVRAAARGAPRDPKPRARLRAAAAARRAAARLPRRPSDRAQLRGQAGRVHPGDRRPRAASARTSSRSTPRSCNGASSAASTRP